MYETVINDARITFTSRRLVKPLRLSSGAISEVTEARAEVTVTTAGQTAAGSGAIYLSDLWAWPDAALSHEERDAGMRRLCEEIAADLPALCGDAAHPLELGMRLHENLRAADKTPPVLARLVCLSPFDAAIHDAVGKAVGLSAFGLYSEPSPMPQADAWFPQGGACAAIARTLRSPQYALDAWLVVGQDDTAEVLAPWIRERRYRAFKLKLLGKDAVADSRRTAEVFEMARGLGAINPRLAGDSNCGNPDADSVVEYLERLEKDSPEAYAALEYLEQPTGRDIAREAFDWHGVTPRRPVILDEGVTSKEQLQLAEAQGWSGIAIKTCRGHSFSLVAAAWASERNLRIAMQDLTNPGIAGIHSALMAAHLPVFNGIELNAAQYTPDANAAFLPRLQPLFEPTDGCHTLPGDIPVGLGTDL